MLKMTLLAIVSALLCGCIAKFARETGPAQRKAYESETAKHHTYPVFGAAGKLDVKLTGHLDNPLWQKCQLLSDFTLPWEPGIKPGRTDFRAFCDSENLYFAFHAWDATPTLVEKWTGKNTLDAEDRVELYISPDREMKNYYCIEIDPLGRVHDFKGAGAGKFDNSWSCEGLQVAATRAEDSYIVEGLIPLKTLKSLVPSFQPEAGQDILPIGLFRADLERTKNNKLLSHWISWIDPQTATPNFHVPSALGAFEIQSPH